MSKTTIYDVAKKANVSIATVSRVIHTPLKVSEQTRTKVYDTFEQLNYSYNALAASTSRGFSNTVGLVLPDIRTPVFADTVAAIQRLSLENNFNVLTGESKYDAQTEKILLQKFIEQRVSGIFLIGYCAENKEFILRIKELGIHVIVLWQKEENNLDCIGIDNYKAAENMVEYLITLGHRDFGFIFAPYEGNVRSHARYLACMNVLSRHNISVDKKMFYPTALTIKSGYHAMNELLARKKTITAVYCNNDSQAIGAIKCLNDKGLSVPFDISVCGFGDDEFAEYLTPPLTTIRVPAYEMGECAANALFGKILENKPIVSVTLEAPLIIRSSCKMREE